MLRDDCYTPVNDQALGSNYVAAGFVSVSTSAPNVNFKRETGALVTKEF